MEEINLYKLLRFYVQNWLLIVSLTLIGLAAGLAYNQFIQVPMYKSSATLLFINPDGRGSTQDATWLNNYVQLFRSRRVIEPVMDKQNINVSFDQFIGSVDATNDKGTEVIKLAVSTDDSEKSRNFLGEALVSFKDEAKKLYGTDNLRVVDNASDTESPYNVKKGLQLLIATTAGFVLSLIVLFFIYDASGGKVGKLGSKKRTKTKQEKATQAAVAVAKPKKIKRLRKTNTRTIRAKAQALSTLIAENMKKNIWIEQTYEDSDGSEDSDEPFNR